MTRQALAVCDFCNQRVEHEKAGRWLMFSVYWEQIAKGAHSNHAEYYMCDVCHSKQIDQTPKGFIWKVFSRQRAK